MNVYICMDGEYIIREKKVPVCRINHKCEIALTQEQFEVCGPGKACEQGGTTCISSTPPAGECEKDSDCGSLVWKNEYLCVMNDIVWRKQEKPKCMENHQCETLKLYVVIEECDSDEYCRMSGKTCISKVDNPNFAGLEDCDTNEDCPDPETLDKICLYNELTRYKRSYSCLAEKCMEAESHSLKRSCNEGNNQFCIEGMDRCKEFS